MLKRIDLFLPPNISQYGVLQHFTQKFYEALLRLGVNCRILESQRDNPKPFLTELFKDPPDCTLSFNGLLPDEQGRFFCDLIQIPHVAIVVDSPNGFVELVKSPLTIIVSVDQDACEFFKGVNASSNVIFMPHGVEKTLHVDPRSKNRSYDVVLLASCIDYEQIRKKWKNQLPKPLPDLLEEVAELSINDTKTSYVNIFVNAIDKAVAEGKELPANLNFIELLDDLEMFIRGRARIALIKSITDARVDIFGSASPSMDWKKQLGTQKNIVIHDSVPYDQAIEIMSRSKIVLNSCAWIKKGFHERMLSGMASGALVFTEENLYVQEKFRDGTDLFLYRFTDLGKINKEINRTLEDESLRQKIAASGQERTLHHHTWDQRAGLLIRELDPIISKGLG